MKLPDDPSPNDNTPDAPGGPGNENPPLDDAHVQELAENQLVHALLVGRFQDTPEIASQRMQRVCGAFDRSLGTTRWHWKAGLSTAAAVLLLGLALFFLPTQNAQAQLNRILDAFDKGDKTYQVEISEDTDQFSPDARRSGKRSAPRPASKPARKRASSQRGDGALLYVRNRQQVLAYTLPTGLKIARGSDGRQGWITGPPTRSSAFRSPPGSWRKLPANNDPNLLRGAEIPEEAVSLLSVDLRDMLHQIRKNYVVSRPQQSPAQDGTTPVLYLVATRVTGRTKLPRQIELWIEAETGQVRDIICTGVSSPRSARPYTLQITLVDTAPLSPDWFTPQAHVSS